MFLVFVAPALLPVGSVDWDYTCTCGTAALGCGILKKILVERRGPRLRHVVWILLFWGFEANG
jgi:hypothetical protein